MNAKLLLSGVALGLLAGVSACQKKTEAPAPSTDSSSTMSAPNSTAPAATPETAAPPAPTTAPSGDSSGSHPFGMQSGRVEYQVIGAETGTEVLSWDNWGGRMAIQTKATMGMTTEDKTTLVATDKVTMVDNLTKTGTSLANPMKDVMMSGGTTDDMTARMMTQMGASKQGTDTVLGKTCDKYVSAMATTCVWQGIALKTESTANGVTTTKIASKIDEGATPDPTVFDVPAGTTVQDMSTMNIPTPGMAAPASNMTPSTTTTTTPSLTPAPQPAPTAPAPSPTPPPGGH